MSSDVEHAFSLSEVESVDSDWLDISSRASDLDSDDLAAVLSRPHSRQSSRSSSSSDGRSIDVWEGMIENTDDEALLEGVDSPVGSPVLSDNPATLRLRGLALHRVTDELRERQALEQSMVSTLSTSRHSSMSSSASSPTPAIARSRDLRLSFPDPLTSSRDDLNRSYDNVHPDEAFPPTHADNEENVIKSDIKPATNTGVITPKDPEELTTPAVLGTEIAADLQVVIYGQQHPDRFDFVETLLSKLAKGSRLNLLERSKNVATQNIVYKFSNKDPNATFTVSLVDKSEPSLREDKQTISFTQPSLAIVVLPSPPTALNTNTHTLFLPLLKTPSNDVDDVSPDALRAAAEGQWKSLSIPSSQLLLWHVDGPSPVLDEREVSALDPTEVVLGFEPLLPRKRRLLNAIRDQIASSPAVTFLAILSIVLGYIVSLSSPLPIPTEEMATSATVKILANASHMTPSPVPVPSPSPVVYENAALVKLPPSSLSTLAPTVEIKPAAILTPNAEAGVQPRTSAALKPTNDCTAASHSLSLSTTKALTVFPPSVKSLSAPSTSASVHALEARRTNTLQELLSTNAVGMAIYSDLKELIDALDELLRAISSQASSSFGTAVGTAKNVREHIRRGNQRAQERARRIRSRGTRALLGARERAWARVEVAQRRAKELHARLSEEAATVTKRVQRSWDERVAEREQRRAARKERRALRERARVERRATRAAARAAPA